MKFQTIALFFLVAVAFGGVLWVFVYPILSGQRHIERRRESVSRSEPAAVRSGRGAQKSRREQVEDALKQIEQKQKKNKKPTLQAKIAQAGLTWTKRQFMLIAAGMGLVAFVLIFLSGFGILPALGFGFAAAGSLKTRAAYPVHSAPTMATCKGAVQNGSPDHPGSNYENRRWSVESRPNWGTRGFGIQVRTPFRDKFSMY